MRDGGSASAKAGSLLIAGLLVVPLAMAAASTGDFVTRGGIAFNGAATETFPSAALFLNDTSQFAISGHFPTARVCVYSVRAVELALSSPLLTTPYQKEGPCFDQSDLRLSLIPGDQAGWAGIHPNGGTLDFTPAGTARMEPRASSYLASPNAEGATVNSGDTEREAQDKPYFAEKAVESRATVNQTGTATYHGPAELKLLGPDVSLQSSTNTTEYRTEETAGNGPAHERGYRWLVIIFDAGSVTLTSTAAPFQIAAPSASVTFDGTASFTADSGSVRIAGVAHDTDAGLSAVIDGRFSASVAPTATGDKLTVKLDGDARSVNLGSARIIAPTDQAGLPLGLIALGVGLAFATGGAALLVVKKRSAARARAEPTLLPAPQPPATEAAWPRPDIIPAPPPLPAGRGLDADYAKRASEAALEAHKAADERRWLIAADLMQKARQEADSPDLAYWHGWFLLQAKQFQAARLALDAASYGIDTGEPERLAALCVVGQLKEARATTPGAESPTLTLEETTDLEAKGAFYLTRALERVQRAGLVDEIAASPDLQDFLSLPSVSEALDHARSRLSVKSWP